MLRNAIARRLLFTLSSCSSVTQTVKTATVSNQRRLYSDSSNLDEVLIARQSDNVESKSVGQPNSSITLGTRTEVLNDGSSVLTERPKSETVNLDVQESATVSDSTTFTVDNEEVPWYMRDEQVQSSFAAPIHQFEMPILPSNSPKSLETIVKHMGTKLSLEDIIIFDMSTVDPESRLAAADLAKYMVICTAKSNKHVLKASTLLYKEVKKQFNQVPLIEGLLKEASGKLSAKRLRKSVRKQGQSNVDGYYGDASSIPNSWAMLETQVDDIWVHVLTKERREELNLELLWASKLEKYKYRRETRLETKENDDIFAGVRYYHTQTDKTLLNTTKEWQLQRFITKRLMSTGQASQTVDSVSAPASITFNETFSLIKKLKTQSKQDIASLFKRSRPLTKPFSKEDIQLFENREAKEIVLSVVSLIAINSKSEHYEVLYNFFDILFQSDRRIVDPHCLSDILQYKFEPVTENDVLRLVQSYISSFGRAQSTELFDLSKEYLQIINNLLGRFAMQGNELDLTNVKQQQIFIKLLEMLSFGGKKQLLTVDQVTNETLRIADCVSGGVSQLPSDASKADSNESTGKVNPKLGSVVMIIQANIEKTLQKIQNQQSESSQVAQAELERFIAFKNEILSVAMTTYAAHGHWQDFWALWKNNKLNIFNNLSIATEADAITAAPAEQYPYYDTRPWSYFFTICLLLNNVKIMDDALNYWMTNYRQYNLAVDLPLKTAILKVLSRLDPEGRSYQMVRKELREV